MEQYSDTDWLYMPLRDAAGAVSLRMFRDRGGERCAVGFTSVERLATLLGPHQRYYRLAERSVRALARERGVMTLIVDPSLVAAAVSEPVEPQRRPLPAISPLGATGIGSAPVRVPALQ